jgi:hypothetical protein
MHLKQRPRTSLSLCEIRTFIKLSQQTSTNNIRTPVFLEPVHYNKQFSVHKHHNYLSHDSVHSPIENLHFIACRFSGGQPRNFSKTQINPPYFISLFEIMRSYFGYCRRKSCPILCSFEYRSSDFFLSLKHKISCSVTLIYT